MMMMMMVCMVSIHPLISILLWGFFFKPVEIIPNALTSTGITITLMYYSIFSSLARSKYSSTFCFLSFSLSDPLERLFTLSFSFQVSLSLPRPSFLVWDFASFSLETSIELFFFPFLFSSYFYSVDPLVIVVLITVLFYYLLIIRKVS